MTNLTDEMILTSLRERFRSLNAQLKEIESQIEKVKVAIEAYDPSLKRGLDSEINSINRDEFNKEYPLKATYQEKVIFLLKEKSRVLTKKEIFKLMNDYENNVSENTLSSNLSNMTSNGILTAYKPRRMKGYYYGNPQWFDEEGKLNKSYEPESETFILWTSHKSES